MVEEFNAMSDGLVEIKDTPIAPGHAIGAIALNMAIKYHDINTVQDGTLYQQYKLEGKNMAPLHLDMVFETAIRIERHLLGASERIAALLVEAFAEPMDDPGNKSEDSDRADAEKDGNHDRR